MQRALHIVAAGHLADHVEPQVESMDPAARQACVAQAASEAGGERTVAIDRGERTLVLARGRDHVLFERDRQLLVQPLPPARRQQ
jgi:hypothetical protein